MTEEPFAVGEPIECFVSMPFSAEFDDVFLKGISNVVDYIEPYRLDLIRLDKEVYARRQIEENVLRNIDASDMLVADITRYRDSPQPNVSVMHEIGYATGRDVPFILIGKKETHKALPSNLKGSLLVEYDPQADPDFRTFSRKLAQQMRRMIEEHVVDRVKGDVRVECFSERHKINLPRLISKATRRVYILTTNLGYTQQYLKPALDHALSNNKSNTAFKVEILTMDPEGDVTNARAIQLGRSIRQYRNELRKSLDEMRDAFSDHPMVEIVTYRSLPTQMTFIVDDVVITAIVSLGQQSREGVHFVLSKVSDMAGPFIDHFRVLKTLAVANA